MMIQAKVQDTKHQALILSCITMEITKVVTCSEFCLAGVFFVPCDHYQPIVLFKNYHVVQKYSECTCYLFSDFFSVQQTAVNCVLSVSHSVMCYCYLNVFPSLHF